MTTDPDRLAEALPRPVKGRCGTCDWPTNTLPCPYCTAEARRDRTEALAPDGGDR